MDIICVISEGIFFFLLELNRYNVYIACFNKLYNVLDMEGVLISDLELSIILPEVRL